MEVAVVEPTGSETLVVMRVSGQEMTCLFRERILPKPGEMIQVQPDIGLVHLFDADSGQRLHYS
jgi:multiple sugar transport system ATP-binding protein